FSKALTWFEKQWWGSLVSYPLVLPHKRCQDPLPAPEPTRGAGAPGTWRPVTPALAAGRTEHVWTTTNWLAYRVAAAFLDQLRDVEPLFPSWEEFHHGS